MSFGMWRFDQTVPTLLCIRTSGGNSLAENSGWIYSCDSGRECCRIRLEMAFDVDHSQHVPSGDRKPKSGISVASARPGSPIHIQIALNFSTTGSAGVRAGGTLP